MKNMKTLGLTLLTAFVGGAVAIGAYKLFEDKPVIGLGLDEKQQLYFANNPSKVVSSTGALDFTEAAAIVSPGVVHVRTTYNRSSSSQNMDPFGDIFEDFFGRRMRPQPNTPSTGKGSGVIVTADGYIMTNNHVVDKADKIEVILTDKRVLSAKVIGKDKNTDLALLKVEARNLPIVRLGNSDDVRVGEWVLAVGYPLTLESTVTAGIVSAKARQIGILAQDNMQRNYDPENPPVSSSIESFIQTDAVINRGNSGGALVNAKGELIGINTAIASQSGVYEGYGFAIPVNLAKKVMDDFIKFGEVKRGFIGITFQELNSDLAKQLEVKEITGLYVSSTVEGGAAASAGIKKGDIIKKLNGDEVLTSAELQERVGRMRPGDKVTLSVLRDGKMRDFNLTLKGADDIKIASSENNVAASEVLNSLGATFSPIKEADKKKYGISTGVEVTSVSAGKLFDMYEVPKGTIITSINGRGVNNINQVNAALAATKGNMLSIQGISPDGGRFRFTFPIKQ